MGCICSQSAKDESPPTDSIPKIQPLTISGTLSNTGTLSLSNKSFNRAASSVKKDDSTITAAPKPHEISKSSSNSRSMAHTNSQSSSNSFMNRSRELYTPASRVNSGSLDKAALNPVMPPKRQVMEVTGSKNIAAVAPAERAGSKRNGGHVRSATVGLGAQNGLVIEDVTNEVDPSGNAIGFSGEHVIAGWPTWLTEVAGEAVQGWNPRRADSFEKLDKIGQGTYSNVYKARDLESGKIVALKKVRFVNMDPESVRFMAREIHILRRLDHPNVIKLEGIVTSRLSHSLYLVFEYMEHDLAGLASMPGIRFTEPQVKCYMQQLMRGLEHCHNRGVLHRDIKGSNLLLDNNGNLKIADFGLATFFDPSQSQPLTSRVVTLWYRPPELLLGSTEYGVAVDLWSTGCILAELLAGKPIMPGRTEVEQLHKIFKLCGSPSDDYWKKAKLPHTTIFKPQHQYRRCVAEAFKDFPQSALSLLDSLLAIEPESRGSCSSALQSDFFKTKPLACDPSALPKYPPSKEYDAKLRDEEARRQRQATHTGRSDSVKPGKKESKVVPAPDNNDLQKQQMQSNPKNASQKYNPQEERRVDFTIDPHGPAEMLTNGFGSSWYNKNESNRAVPGRTYSSVRVSNVPQLKSQRSCKPQPGSTDFQIGAGRASSQTHYNRLDVSEQRDNKSGGLERGGSSHKKDSGTTSHLGYVAKNRRIHYSGPLMPPGGNMEDMLREHERQIQQAVRKARLDKDKTNKHFY